MKIKKGFILRKVGADNVVVPVGANAKTFHGMVKLNETGAFLWNFFTAEHSKEEGVQALLGEYEGADRESVEKDVSAFLEILKKHSFAE